MFNVKEELAIFRLYILYNRLELSFLYFYSTLHGLQQYRFVDLPRLRRESAPPFCSRNDIRHLTV